MKTNIIVSLQFQAVHKWENCNLKKVNYLKYTHRHIFYMTCKKEVNHDDRKIEIIMLKNSILKYLNDKYYDETFGMGNFKNQSCEMIAKEILQYFNLNYCKVLEDNENGGEVML